MHGSDDLFIALARRPADNVYLSLVQEVDVLLLLIKCDYKRLTSEVLFK